MKSGTSTAHHRLRFLGSDDVARSTLSVYGGDQSAETSIEVNLFMETISRMTQIRRNIRYLSRITHVLQPSGLGTIPV
jgi:hypothetical protein